MTHYKTIFKTALISTALATAFAAAPAMADGHDDGAMKKAKKMMMDSDMSMDEKMAKWQNMSAADRMAKLQNVSVEDHMKWQSKSAEEKQMWLATLSDEEKQVFKTSIKKHNMRQHDDNMKARMEMKPESMKMDKMKMKDGMHMGSHSMTAEQRMEAEKRIINAMSSEQKAKYMSMSPENRKLMMNKKLAADYMPGDKMMKDRSMGEVLQNDAMSGTSESRSIAVPTMSSNVTTTVNCPSGTTAQPNGTCLITGNYNPS